MESRRIIRMAWIKCLMIFLTTVPLADAADEQTRHIQYGFTLRNTRGAVIDRAEFWTYAPVNKTSAQSVERLHVSHPHDLIEDAQGNQILHFVFPNFPPYGTKIVRIEADLQMGTSPLPSATPDGSTTNARRYVEIDHPAFIEQAPVFNANSPSQTVHRIFLWVSRHVSDEGYVRKPAGALYALKHGIGDCTEYMYLFIALCRRAGIPARGIGGYICSRNTILSPEGYHNWAEFYEGGRWWIADPQRNVLRDQSENYVALRMIGEGESPMSDAPRFRFVGHGLKVKMN